ncbi:MAG: sugar phosphate isomerase/epimerase [Pirellulales bacterium]|nr:sugar phosphate isomerase/epimerase [Pirellulales bacterium]
MTERTRRDFLKQAAGATAAIAVGAAAAPLAAAEKENRMKFAFCNEPFYNPQRPDEWPQARVFEFLAQCGYQAVEIAPFTINPDVTLIPDAQRNDLRRAADQAGIQICGLHWILSKTTAGFNLTSPDRDVRTKTSKYLGELARLCAELGGDVMVFGSPMQRNRAETAEQAISMVEAYQNAADVLKAVVPVLESTGVTIAMEPLSTWETNFLLTAEDGARLKNLVGSPRVSFMLDCKAMWAMEPEPIPDVVRRYRGQFFHFHANDPNLQGPGFGQLDFVPIFHALKETGYNRWVSVEPLEYSPGPERLARESIRYMKECLAKV